MRHFAGAARVFLLAAASMLLLTAFAFAAEEDMAYSAGATTGSSLRLRAEPSTDASIITMLDRDVVVAVLDDTLDGWYEINYNGTTGYVSADYLEINEDGVFETCGRVVGNGVNLRADTSTDAEILLCLEENDTVDVTGLLDGWYSVYTEDGLEGYIRSDFLTLTRYASGTSSNDVIDYARQFLGTRYVYGGASPSGFDCSGFTMYVYNQFGVSLPHTATGQWQSGLGTRVYDIWSLQPGDLVFFCEPGRNNGKACSHAGLYAGNGQIIHSSSSRSGGVIMSDLTSGYYNTYFVGGIHL
ncbi:MAG: C40 family peptidase [Oscillibacter sp.]|nr:C40 family peptidase [Oscillibacter sp.]